MRGAPSCFAMLLGIRTQLEISKGVLVKGTVRSDWVGRFENRSVAKVLVRSITDMCSNISSFDVEFSNVV